MRMRDDRARHILPRINVEIAGWAIQPAICVYDQGIVRHRRQFNQLILWRDMSKVFGDGNAADLTNDAYEGQRRITQDFFAIASFHACR